MISILNAIEKMARSNEELTYIILTISAFIENVFPPIPGDTVTVFAAFLVGKKALDFTWVLISTTIGSFLGFMTLFYLALFFGRSLLEKKQWKFFNMKQIEKVNKWFNKYGYLVILANRFLAGLRSVVSIAAGIVKFKPQIVTLLAFLSCLLWNAILLYLGYIAGDNWKDILSYIQQYSNIVLFIIVLSISFFVFKWLIKRNKTTNSKQI